MDELPLKQAFRKKRLIKVTQNKTIWEVVNIYDGNVLVAKVQPTIENSHQRTILHEGKFLQTTQGQPGIPFLSWCGKDQPLKISMLIQQKLGKTLRQLKQMVGGKFSLKTVCMIGLQLFKILACYHQKGYVHRRISLDTLQFGCKDKVDKLYFNDFIQSKSVFKKNTFEHIQKKTNLKIKWMSQFLSYDALSGVELVRKDDVQSVILLLIFLFKGSLPWSYLYKQQVKFKLNQKELKKSSSDQWKQQKWIQTQKQIMEQNPPEKLCSGLPQQFLQMLLDIRSLEFTDKPIYLKYIMLLQNLMHHQNLHNDNLYDWMQRKYLLKKQKMGLKLQNLFKKNEQITCKLQREDEVLQIYNKYQGYVQIDRLGGTQ